MVQIKSTKGFGVTVKPKIVVYGDSGVGKTTLAKTKEKTLILSAEGGLLSLTDKDIPYVEIGNFASILETYQWLTEDPKAKEFEHLMFDSLSDVAEVVLEYEKTQVNDKRQAYGQLADKMMYIIRQFRDLQDFAVTFICKLDKNKDEVTGAMLYGPLMPGQVLTKQLPYLVDEVLALRMTMPDPQGNCERFLQTQPDYQWAAKDRAGKLLPREPADLQWIHDKLAGLRPQRVWYYHDSSDSYVLMTERESISSQAAGEDVVRIGGDESVEKHKAYIKKQLAARAQAEKAGE